MLRGRRRWLTALPACVLKPDAFSLIPGLEADFIRVAVEKRREEPLESFKPSQEATARQGRGFYSALFLEEVGPFLALPACIAAIAAFVRAMDRDSARVTRRHPPKEGPQANSGWDRKWVPWEDNVLRAWFGKRTVGEHAGKHAPLSDQQWESVLQDRLKGRRTKAQVKVRISALNRQLRHSMLVDGFLPRDKVAEFQRLALGEHRIRVPRFRPRIRGRSYRGGEGPALAGQPD